MDKFIGNKIFACIFIAVPVIIYCIFENDFWLMVTLELFSIAYFIMVILDCDKIKKLYTKMFCLIICGEILYICEALHLRHSFIILLCVLTIFTIFDIVHSFIKLE